MASKYSQTQQKDTSLAKLHKNTAALQVELQALQFLLAQGITLGRSQISIIEFEEESLTKEIHHLVSTIRGLV